MQHHVASMLRAHLPEQIWWTASLSGVRLSPHIAARAKAAGMQKGAPDLSFIFPDGVTKYIELKSADGVLTLEQKALLARLGPLGLFAVARSWPEVREVMELWLAEYGLRLLTDTESVRRSLRRAA